MKQIIKPIALLLSVALISCGEEAKEQESNQSTEDVPKEEQVAEEAKDPKEMLKDAYQLFKEGDDAQSIALAEEVLKIGHETKNDTLIGDALSSLCRNAQRTLDTVSLADLSEQLKALAESSGNQKWMMKRAHMNAEMWRLVGNMERAEAFYNESLSISEAIGSKGMFMIDHFNKSFVSTAIGDFEEARRLIAKYYALRREYDPENEDAYGLIALAYLLEQEQNFEGAHEVATVTRRLFKEQNIFPEPPDEKPLLAVEAKVQKELSEESYNQINEASLEETVGSLLNKYLEGTTDL